ncbi:MAG: hypothetical protein ACHQ01_07350 [Candidatus Limnocylindrales bacterium]
MTAALSLPVATKVPEITIYFWAIKVLTTAMGEVTSDYLVHAFDPVIVVPLVSRAAAG